MTHPGRRSVQAMIVALAVAQAAAAQQFELRSRSATPWHAPMLANNGGIALDIDQSGHLDVLLKGGAALIADGNLGFTWSQPGTRVPTVGGLPNFFDFAADVAGDGVPDLVGVFASLSLTTDVYVNSGLSGGYFAPRVAVGSVGGIVTPILLRDFDGDTFPDLLGHRYYPTRENVLLRNQGDGTFVEVSATSLPAMPMDPVVAVADWTGDGLPDMVVRSNGALLLLVNAGGSFVSAAVGLPVLAALQGLYCADADADGDQDLLIATSAGAPLQLWLGDGAGSFTVSSAVLPAAGTGHAFADLDGDLRADLVSIEASPLGQQLRARRNVGGLQFALISSTLVDATMTLGEPLLADLEGDGDLDAIVGGSLFYLNGGSLGFQALQLLPIAETAVEDTILAGDLDGDESVDLVIGDSLHRNRGDGWFTNLGAMIPSGARARALFDLDNDDDLDLVWTRATTGAFDAGILVNQSGVLVAGPTFPGTLLAGRVFPDDFDNDGLVDLVSESRQVLRNLGGAAFAAVATLAVPSRPVATGDFDSDGQSDIVVAQGNSWVLLQNLGNHVFQAGQPVAGSIQRAVVGDFDGDLRSDLAVSFVAAVGSSNAGHLRVWTLQPAGWVGGAALQDGWETTGNLAAGDFDRDGDLDLVGQTLWTNLGSGQFVTTSSGVQFSSALAVADIDADRDLDIVRAANETTGNARRPCVFANRLVDVDADRLFVLGNTYTISVGSHFGSGPGGAPAFIALALSRGPALSLPGIGTLFVDPSSVVAVPLGLTDPTGRCAFPILLPRSPVLAGMEVYWQGAVVGASSLRLTGLWIDRLLL